MFSFRLTPTVTFFSYLITMSIVLGCISKRCTSNLIIPIDWNKLAGVSLALIQMSYCYCILVAPIIVVLLLVAIFKMPKKLTSQSLILLTPFVPTALMVLWGSFTWISFPEGSIFGYEHWTYKVFEALIDVYHSHFILIATFITFSSKWEKNRLFGMSILITEFCCFFVFKAFSSMACSRVWP